MIEKVLHEAKGMLNPKSGHRTPIYIPNLLQRLGWTKEEFEPIRKELVRKDIIRMIAGNACFVLRPSGVQ